MIPSPPGRPRAAQPPSSASSRSVDRAGVPPPDLSRMSLFARLAVIGGTVAALGGGFAYAGGWLRPGKLTQTRLIDTFEKVNGAHPGFRRNHAKGLCVTGEFDANGRGAHWSTASVLSAGQVPVVGRFALAGGQPYAADAVATVRSMALRFLPGDGQEWRTGMNDIPVFAVNTPQAFYEQLLASAPDPATGKPDPERMKAFLAAHPETVKAVGLIRHRAPAQGFADSTYNSLDAFRFVAADGSSVPVRWAMVPATALPTPSPAPSAAEQDPNRVFDALIARLRQGPLQWHLVVTIGRPGDPTRDATLPWPEDRMKVDVGTLTLTRAQSEDVGACRDLNFDPLVLPKGIEPSDDPLLSARSAAYSRSFREREGEAKSPSAVQPDRPPSIAAAAQGVRHE